MSGSSYNQSRDSESDNPEGEKITKRKVTGYLTSNKIMIYQNCWIKKLIVEVRMNMKRVEMESIQKQRLTYQAVYQDMVFDNNVNIDFT